MNRRRFFHQITLATAVVSAWGRRLTWADDLNKIDETNLQAGLPVIQCATGRDFTHLSVDRPKTLSVRYELIDSNTGESYAPTGKIFSTRDEHDWGVEKISFENLTLGTTYILKIWRSNGTLIDERSLQLLDPDKQDARVAFLSCMLQARPNRTMWNHVQALNADVLFFIGDNVYGDVFGVFGSPKVLWSSYIKARQAMSFYYWKNLKPVVAVWDDHDYGINDGDTRYIHKEESLRQFRAFYNQPECATYSPSAGAGGLFTAFGRQFFFFDCRSQRDGQSTPRRYLGAEQLRWAKNRLNTDLRSWYLQGCQFFGQYTTGSGSYELNAPEEFAEFQRTFTPADRNATCVAGDIHYSEIMKLNAPETGAPITEITSSGLHTYPTTTFHEYNPRRRQSMINENFIYADLSAHGRSKLVGVTLNGKSFEESFNE